MEVSLSLALFLLLGVTSIWGFPSYKDGEGQLSTGTPGADTSFLLDSRGGVETFQGSLPKKELLQAHEEYKDKFEKFRAEAEDLPEGVAPLTDDNQFQFAYEVNAQSTGDKKSHIEVRKGDVVHGRYTVVEPDGSLRIVTYRVLPDTGFQASVERVFDFDEPNHPNLNAGNRKLPSASSTLVAGKRRFDISRQNENRRRISSSFSPSSSSSSDLKDLVGANLGSLNQGDLDRTTALVQVSNDKHLSTPTFTDQYTSSSTVDEHTLEIVDISTPDEKKKEIKHPKKALRLKQQAYLTILPVIIQSRVLKRNEPVDKASTRP